MSKLVEDAVRVLLNGRNSAESEPAPFLLVTHGAGGTFSKYNIDKISGLIAAEDLEQYGSDES